MATNGEKVSNETLLYMLKTLQENLDRSVEERKQSFEELKETIQKQHESQNALKDEIQNYKIRGDTVVRIFKWIVGLLVAIVTFKLGDVKSLFVSLFGK
jgi:hypothetical protein